MSTFPDNETIYKLALELNTEPAFLEKDWHVSHIIRLLAQAENETFEPIFCGGTSLLKGYQLINRFSEDVDFRILAKRKETTQKDRRAYRIALLESINDLPELEVIDESLLKGDKSRFFSVMIRYPKRFGDHMSIRPEVKLEGTFVQDVLPNSERRTITPLIGRYIEVDCTCSLQCLSLLEKAADKLSALIWRVLSRDRDIETDDVTIIRHLCDLHYLITALPEHLGSIRATAKMRYRLDHKRGDNVPEEFKEAYQATCDLLREDPLYKDEYEHYVMSMCFGKDKPPDFGEALSSVTRLLE